MSPVRTSSPPRRRLPVPLGILTSSSFCAPLQESNSKPQSGSRVPSSRAIRSPTLVVAASGQSRLSREQMRRSRCAEADARESPIASAYSRLPAERVSGTLVGRRACDRKSSQEHQLKGRKWLENAPRQQHEIQQ